MCVNDPDTPATVTVYVPRGVVVEVPTDRIDVIVPFAAGVTERGEREHVTVTETGEIAQVNPTAELKPLSEVTEIVEVVKFPIVVVAEAGTAVMLKSRGAPTFRE